MLSTDTETEMMFFSSQSEEDRMIEEFHYQYDDYCFMVELHRFAEEQRELTFEMMSAED